MKKIKKINPNSNNSNKQKDDSHLDFCETENPSKKRKTLNLKNPKKLIKNPINEPNNDIDSQNQDFIFKGIGEKDPSLSQINTDELEYPFWLKPENIKDIQGRSFHNDGNYDPSTLLIPEKEIKKQSAVFKQYWAIKSKNFDKIVFFRYFKNYVLAFFNGYLFYVIACFYC